MKHSIAILGAAALLALTACGGEPDPATGTEADDFAARINGSGAASGNSPPTTGDAPRPMVTPTVVEPLPNAAPGPYAPGTATDPAAATCDANKMGAFMGRVADARSRMEIEETASPGREIRFLRPGGVFLKPDASSPRLNIMLDAQDIIRDARCG